MNDTEDIPEVKVTLPPPRFANPFQGLKGDPTASTVNCLIPRDIFYRVKQCRLEGGTVQTTMNYLWIKLVDLLNRKSINDYSDVREFEDAVQRAVLVLPEDIANAIDTAIARAIDAGVPGKPTPSADIKANVGNDVGGAERVRPGSPGESQQSDVPYSGGKGSRKRKPKQSKHGKD